MLYKFFFLTELKKNNNIYFNQAKFKKDKFRQTNGKDFVTELFCLSKSKIIISTVGGAVTNAAYLISKKKIKIYKWTNIINIFFFIKIIVLTVFLLKKLNFFFKKFFL
jgi:hypothetical protein